jgi:hypothetical protein
MSEDGGRGDFAVVSDGGVADDRGTASYVFRVRFRVEPNPPQVSIEPSSFETVLTRAADPPGEEGWLFFRDNLWRGECNDAAHFRELTEEALGVSVESVTFSELQTDETYLDALRSEIAANLDTFAADSVDEALSKYLGSSIRVIEDP